MTDDVGVPVPEERPSTEAGSVARTRSAGSSSTDAHHLADVREAGRVSTGPSPASFTDHRVLAGAAYGDGRNLSARQALYQWMRPRHDPAGMVSSRVAAHLNRYPPHGPGRVLDVGAGNGLYTRRLHVDHPELAVVAMDISPGILREVPRPTLVADAARLPFADDRRYRVAREVVIGGSETAAHHDEVAARQGLLEKLCDAAMVVADPGRPEDVDSQAGELACQVRAVGIDDLTEEQLGADADELGRADERHVRGYQSVPSAGGEVTRQSGWCSIAQVRTDPACEGMSSSSPPTISS